MRRISRLAYSLLTATTLQLAACDDGTDGDGVTADPATFATATQLQKERAVIAGAGFDASLAMILASSYASAGGDGAACPTVTRSGDTTTITGGCTLDGGDAIRGKAVAKNLPSFTGEGFDPSRPIEITFEELRFEQAEGDDDLAFDGTLAIAPTGRITAALTATIGGLEVVSDATWRHEGDLTSAEAGSTVALRDLGAAEIVGRWSMDSEAPAGAIELHGADVMKVDFGASQNGCAPITIDGQPGGQICESTDAE